MRWIPAICLSVALLGPLDASGRGRVRTVGRALRTEGLRGWTAFRHRRYARKVARVQKHLDRLAKQIGIKHKVSRYITSNVEQRLESSLLEEARTLWDSRPGTIAHRRLQVVKRRLLKLRENFARDIGDDGGIAFTYGHKVGVHAERAEHKDPVLVFGHELQHVRDHEQGRLTTDRMKEPKKYARNEVRAEVTAGFASGQARRRLARQHIPYHDSDVVEEQLNPPGPMSKGIITGYIIGVRRALKVKREGASRRDKVLADAYLRGYEERLRDESDRALKRIPRARKAGGPPQAVSTLRKLGDLLVKTGKRALPDVRWTAQSARRRGRQLLWSIRRIDSIEAALEAGKKDAAQDIAPHRALERILSGRRTGSGPVGASPPKLDTIPKGLTPDMIPEHLQKDLQQQ